MDIYIYGTHAVMEALASKKKVLSRILVTRERRTRELESLAERQGVVVGPLDLGTLPREVDREAVHQGVLGIIASTRLMQDYKDFINPLTVSPDTALVLLGEVQDPHNVGAIIRSAAAFGVAGVLIPEHNQAQVTGSVIKVSAGMAFTVPLVAVGNVNTTARDLKKRGFWIYGLDGDAPQGIDDEAFDRPSVFVLGNEGRGLREKTRDVCDVLLSIPMHSRCESLNVSVSAAVTLHAWSRSHRGALGSA